MEILFGLAVLYIVLFVVSALFNCVVNKVWSSKDNLRLFVFLVSVIFISFFAVPSVSDDLYRWYANINWYRLGKPLFWEFSKVVMPIQTNAIFIFNFSMQLVSKMSNNGYLQVIWLIVNFGALYTVWVHYVKKYNPPKYYLYMYFLLFFGLTPYFYSLSGLRYNAISSLIFLGVYFSIFENKKFIIYLLFLFSLFVHQSAAMLLMIYLCFEFGKRYKVYRLIIFWHLFVDVMIYLVKLLPGEIFQLLANKMYYYFYEFSSATDIRLKIILSIFIVLLLMSIYFLEHRFKKLGKEYYEYTCFLECVLLFCVGTYGNYTIFLRGIHFLGYCLLPYNFMLFKSIIKRKYVVLAEVFGAIGLNAYYLVTLFTYFQFVI